MKRDSSPPFFYDGSGNKIKEISGNRETSYTYDALGFLETTTCGDQAQVEIHNVQGSVLEKWEKKGSHVENHTKLHYNAKGLLEKTERITSQETVYDLFSYDAEGRLCRHEDPLHAVTKFEYYPVRNKLGQMVFCKVTINDLGCKTLEIDDATNKIVSREKQDAQGRTLSLEEFFYPNFSGFLYEK